MVLEKVVVLLHIFFRELFDSKCKCRKMHATELMICTLDMIFLGC